MVPQFRQICLVSVVVLLEGLSLAGCPPPQPQPPGAAFTCSSRTGTVPLSVAFTDQSAPGSSAILSWVWSFGDGGMSTSQHPVHTYIQTGTYTVSLTVTTADGTDTEAKPGWITVVSPGEGEDEGQSEGQFEGEGEGGPVEGALEEGEMEGQTEGGIEGSNEGEGGGEGEGQNEGEGETNAALFQQLFSIGYDAGTLGTDLVALAADSVWMASEQNGGKLTLTGTLTQSGTNPEVWTYAPAPANKLVGVFSSGAAVELMFAVFEGDLNGSAEDFTYHHQVDFTVFRQNVMNLRVQSRKNYTKTWSTAWQRSLAGTLLYEGKTFEINILDDGSEKECYVESPFAYCEYLQEFSGTATAGSTRITIDERSDVTIAHNANIGQHVKQVQWWKNNSMTTEGASYQLQNCHVNFIAASLINDPGAFNVVLEPEKWSARGMAYQNGSLYGSVQFTGPVIADTHGPDLVLRRVSGETIFLNTLIDFP